MATLHLSSDVGETTATISFSSWGFSYQGTITGYSGTIGGKDVSSSSGSVYLSGLTRGRSYTISGTIFCHYRWTTTSTSTNPDGSTSTTTTTHTGSSSASDSINIYTHPGSFSMGASKEAIINEILTVSKIKEWANHFNLVYHWYNQKNNDYKGLDNLKVNSDDLITADWFNRCMDAMNSVGRNYRYVSGGVNGTIISADIINRLNFSGTG